MGGAAFDAERKLDVQAEMAARGAQQNIISRAEADTFLFVHSEVDKLKVAEAERQGGGMADVQNVMLVQLLSNGHISAQEAEMFADSHDWLMAAVYLE